MFYRRKIFDDIGNFNIKYKITADYEKLCDIYIAKLKIKKIDLLLCEYLDGGYSRKHYINSNIERMTVIKSKFGKLSFLDIINHILNIAKAYIISIKKSIK